MSRGNYPNRNALDDALQVYLQAMYPFVNECLGEELLRKALRLPSDSNIEEEIEVKDIANLIRPRDRWDNYFKKKFEIIDRYGKTRYYDAQSVASLIVEGRNRVSHPPWDLDPEFTRAQLFLIAEILEKIEKPDAQREVETIRKKLFDDTMEQLVATAVEAKEAAYEKSISELEKRLAAGKKKNKELSKEVDDNTAKLNETMEKRDELSEKFVSIKLSKEKSEEQLNSKSKEFEKLQAVHSACEERLTATEAERDDYKEGFETASREREEAETEWQACEDSLTAIRQLFITAAIGNQEVQAIFFPIEADSTTWILDRRGVEKKNYLLELLEQKQPTLIYVQSEEMADLLLERVIPEKVDLIEKHGEHTSEAEEKGILEKLENGEKIAVVSNTTFSILTSAHCVEHFVFCHLVPSLDKFFNQCEPAFASKKNAYLHLIYNSEQDVEGLNQWLTQKYPDREALEKLYSELTKLAGANGDFINTESLYSKLDMAKLGIETGLAIFEELHLLERNDEGIRLLPPAGNKLDESEIYRKGEQLKKKTADFQAFQLERSVEKIWVEILEKLNVDSEQMLREVSSDEMHASVSEMENDRQPAEIIEDDNQADEEDIEASQTSEPARANAAERRSSIAERYVRETTEEERNLLAVQIAEMRINATGSRPIAWKNIREPFGLKEDEFHKVIRLSKGYRDAVIARIKTLKAQDGGWEYNGKLGSLTGIDNIEDFLK